MQVKVGIYTSPDFLSRPQEERIALVRMIEAAGIDHVFVGDHVSFHNGFGMDGLIDAAGLAAMSNSLSVMVGVYLLALRHPVPVARQLASLARSSPGRLVLGVGIGGEDAHEMEICGLDPSKRGRATNHALSAVRQLLSGMPTTCRNAFFSFDNALILPAPEPPIPIMIGGRSPAAARRTAEHGDGWLGIWCSPARFGAFAEEVQALAESAGRAVHLQHGLQVWVGFGDSARDRLASTMQNMYQIPFEPFEKYSPYGTPEVVAEFLAAYVEQGARTFNLACCGDSFEHEIACVAEVRRLLGREFPTLSTMNERSNRV